jgi:hypothetical protein
VKMAATGKQKALFRWPPRSPDLTPRGFFYGDMLRAVFLTPLPQDLLRRRIIAAISEINRDMLQRVWAEMDYRLDVCHVAKDGHTDLL